MSKWEWHWQATGTSGGQIVGGCKTTKDLSEIVAKLADNPETESIRIGKFHWDYNPMLSPHEFIEKLNESRKQP